MNELPVPPELDSDPEATEVLRAWVVEDHLECSLLTGVFEEPEMWGSLLADLIRTVAQGLEEQEGKDQQEMIERIVAAFEQEINAPPEEEDDEE